jgi:hypothetical protein
LRRNAGFACDPLPTHTIRFGLDIGGTLGGTVTS